MRAVRRVDTVRGGAVGLLPRTWGELRLSQSLTARMAPRLSGFSISTHIQSIEWCLGMQPGETNSPEGCPHSAP